MLHIKQTSSKFPKPLTKIHNPPKELFVESRHWEELLEKPLLAVVGSRRLSTYGRTVTDTLVRSVAARGVVIVSGLALGIDSVAHKAAIDAGGQTIVVLPSGLENIYPASHADLAKRIIEQNGALIAEYPPKTTAAFKGNFIARNRLIAGLAQATLITEAAERSGSLHTANFALEQGHEVLAVPGSITNPNSAGCNNLIKTGARPVTSPEDIFEALGLDIIASDHEIHAANPAEHAILSLIKAGKHDGEVIHQESGLDFTEYQQTLSMLEITGKIRAVGNNHWILQG